MRKYRAVITLEFVVLIVLYYGVILCFDGNFNSAGKLYVSDIAQW